MNKLIPEELLNIISLLIVSIILSIKIVNLIIKCHQEDIFKYEHKKINDTIKQTKKRLDKEIKRYEKQIKNKNNERNNKR